MLNAGHPPKKHRTGSFARVLSLLSLAASIESHATDTAAWENLVFVPVPLTAEQPLTTEMPLQDSTYHTLMVRNLSPQAILPQNGAIEWQAGLYPGSHDYEQRVQTIEQEAGPFDPALIEVLHSLGNHYLTQQRFEEALASFEREEHLNRVHFGLFSQAQLPSVKAQIKALVGAGMIEKADEKQQYLIYLLEKCYGRKDARLMPSLISYAEWNMSRFNDIVRFEFADAPLMGLGSGFTSETEYRERAFEKLDEAVVQYARVATSLLENRQFHDPTLYQLENRLVESAFLQANRQKVVENPDSYLLELNLEEEMYRKGSYSRLTRDAYKYGLKSYERQLTYISNDPAGSMGRYIDTLLAQGDWYVLFGKHTTGYAKYQEAHELLASLDISDETIASVLRPEIPVTMPTFTATPYSPQSMDQRNRITNPYRGYIDVCFGINRNGNARKVEVLGKSAETNRTIERRLVRMIMGSQFRPRFNGEELALSDEVTLRYYYTY